MIKMLKTTKLGSNKRKKPRKRRVFPKLRKLKKMKLPPQLLLQQRPLRTKKMRMRSRKNLRKRSLIMKMFKS
jgi:hypothetical protein